MLILLCGCAALPVDPQRLPSTALPMSGKTALGALAASAAHGEAGSGFRLLPAGDVAFDARLALLRRAEHSIDLQSFEIRDDESGRRVLTLLCEAAARGVRVRVLVDDLHTVGEDDLLLKVAHQVGIQLRLFNPFAAGRGNEWTRLAFSMFDLPRLNRRMHNKLMIIDGAVAIVGGRNIAADYFLRDSDTNFLDLDVLVVGTLLPRLQTIFDRYWNSDLAVSIQAAAGRAGPIVPTDERCDGANVASNYDTDRAAADTRDMLGHTPVSAELASGHLELVWATGKAYADDPAKAMAFAPGARARAAEDKQSVRDQLRTRTDQARAEIVMTSPYLVPGTQGMAFISQLRQRGVRLTMLTNSLSATDEPMVFAAYSRYRKPLLELGVELFELSPTRVAASHEFHLFHTSLGRLHAKTAVIDRKTVFIGSMNLDPRSDTTNTEIGLIIDSPVLAHQVLGLIEMVQRNGGYRLRLSPQGDIRWIAADPAPATVIDADPDTTALQRGLLQLVLPLLPEDLL